MAAHKSAAALSRNERSSNTVSSSQCTVGVPAGLRCPQATVKAHKYAAPLNSSERSRNQQAWLLIAGVDARLLVSGELRAVIESAVSSSNPSVSSRLNSPQCTVASVTAPKGVGTHTRACLAARPAAPHTQQPQAPAPAGARQHWSWLACCGAAGRLETKTVPTDAELYPHPRPRPALQHLVRIAAGCCSSPARASTGAGGAAAAAAH